MRCTIFYVNLRFIDPGWTASGAVPDCASCARFGCSAESGKNLGRARIVVDRLRLFCETLRALGRLSARRHAPARGIGSRCHPHTCPKTSFPPRSQAPDSACPKFASLVARKHILWYWPKQVTVKGDFSWV